MASNDMGKFVNQELRDEIEKIMSDYKAKFDKGDNFNIFISAKIEQKENYMRNFLADLLRKDGRHGMQDFFQESFLEDVLGISGEEIVEITPEDKTYKNGTKRRIDLTIETNKRFIPIEVKINASDQDRQCQDYYNEIEKRNEGKETVLYYLTKECHHSLSKKSQGKLEIGTQVKYIYFKKNNPEETSEDTNDIVSWLKECSRGISDTERPRVFYGLLQFQEAIEFWFDKESELKEIRDKVKEALKSLKQDSKKAFADCVENYSEKDPVILKIKECYDYYKEVILEHEFFGCIDQMIKDKHPEHIELIIEHQNRGSEYKCAPIEGHGGKYDIWLNFEPRFGEGTIYYGYCLANKDGKYVSCKSIEPGERERVLGYRPNPKDIPQNNEWLVLKEIEINCNDVKKLVFNKDELDEKIKECVNKLDQLLKERYGGKNEQPLKTI